MYFYGKYLEYSWISTRWLLKYAGLSSFIQNAEAAVQQVRPSFTVCDVYVGLSGIDQIRTARTGQSLSIESLHEETRAMVTEQRSPSLLTHAVFRSQG